MILVVALAFMLCCVLEKFCVSAFEAWSYVATKNVKVCRHTALEGIVVL